MPPNETARADGLHCVYGACRARLNACPPVLCSPGCCFQMSAVDPLKYMLSGAKETRESMSEQNTAPVLFDLRQMSGTDHAGQTAIRAAEEIERLRSLLQDVVDDMTFNVAPSKATMAKIEEALK